MVKICIADAHYRGVLSTEAKSCALATIARRDKIRPYVKKSCSCVVFVEVEMPETYEVTMGSAGVRP